ncbi:MAG TPA: hypothetical protein VJQ25_03355 [Nitrospira sp.]|nr:hypothetical protein [Nitrospira sp.]
MFELVAIPIETSVHSVPSIDRSDQAYLVHYHGRCFRMVDTWIYERPLKNGEQTTKHIVTVEPSTEMFRPGDQAVLLHPQTKVKLWRAIMKMTKPHKSSKRK